MKIPQIAKAALALILSFCAVSSEATQYKIATNVSEDSTAGRLLAELSKTVEQKTSGRVQLKIFANSMLGDQNQYFQEIRKGNIDLGLVNAATLESVIPAFGVLNLPYMFRTSSEYRTVLTNADLQKFLFEKASEQSIPTLGFLASGFRSIYTSKPIKSFKELAGLRLRTMSSATYEDMIKAFGATPIPLPLGELLSGLKVGAVDGAEGGLAGLSNEKFGEAAKYVIDSEHTRLTDFVVTSVKFQKSISSADYEVIKSEFAKGSVKSIEISDQAEQTGLDKAVKDYGVTLTKVDKAPFIKAVEPLYSKAKENSEKSQLLKMIFTLEKRKL